MSLHLIIKVVPGAGRRAFARDESGTLKCFLTSQPERGRANRELIEVLADALNIRRSAIRIVSGFTTRTKKICIDASVTLERVLENLGVSEQSTPKADRS